MNFWAEQGLDLPAPSVQLADVDGRRCVAIKEREGDPTTYIFPRHPNDFDLIQYLAEDMFTSPDLLGSQKARAALLALTTSEETPPDFSTLPDTPVHICIVDGPAKNCTP